MMKKTRIKHCKQNCLIPTVFIYVCSKKLKLSQAIENYVNKHFNSCLSNSVRKAVAANNPLPNIPVLTALVADHVIVDYMGGAFPTKPDTQLKHLQSTVIAAAAAAPTLKICGLSWRSKR